MAGDHRRSGVERFIFHLAQFPAVDGISKISAEFLDVKSVCAAANFFIWGEADLERAMVRSFFLLCQVCWLSG